LYDFTSGFIPELIHSKAPMNPAVLPLKSLYGHHNVNRRTHRDGVLYVNNALGYPSEHKISAKQMICVAEE
jgi:hypothetical protein